jgi:hypothetical protein
MDLALDQVLLKRRVACVAHREVEWAISVENQPSHNANDAWMDAAGRSSVIIERRYIVISAPGLAWAPVIADEHA